MEIEIPYRLDNPEAIEQAMRQNLLNLGDAYEYLLKVASALPLERPPAFLHARAVVKKDFQMFTQEKMERFDFVYEELANINLASNFHRLESKIPWSREIAGYHDLFYYLESFPQEIRDAWKLRAYPNSLTEMYERQISLHRLVKREMLRFVKRGNKRPVETDYAKRLLVALVLFDPIQEDVLQALRKDQGTGESTVLCRNAHAELLFLRIPRKINELLVTDPRTIRRKLFNKIERLAIPARQRMNIFGYFKAGISHDDLLPILKRINSVISKMSITSDTKEKLTNYIGSLIQTIENVPRVYRELFLDRELDAIRQLNGIGAWLRSSVAYSEEILKTFTRSVSLEFYPTKDYLDLYKGLVSGDCTLEKSLAEEHLKTPNYFSIRIFLTGEWIGNIYMLDFVEQQGILVLDRIQAPRHLKVFYHRFFEQLSDLFQELFANVPYKYIAAPLAISNHKFLQTAFNSYRKGLPSVKLSFDTPYEIFESLRKNQNYCVLARKETTL